MADQTHLKINQRPDRQLKDTFEEISQNLAETNNEMENTVEEF